MIDVEHFFTIHICKKNKNCFDDNKIFKNLKYQYFQKSYENEHLAILQMNVNKDLRKCNFLIEKVNY